MFGLFYSGIHSYGKVKTITTTENGNDNNGSSSSPIYTLPVDFSNTEPPSVFYDYDLGTEAGCSGNDSVIFNVFIQLVVQRIDKKPTCKPGDFNISNGI